VSWFLAFAGFAALIILHEGGHFAAAKAVGMRVERFSLFFPPLLVRKKIGETEYCIGALPLGGYVKISGMNPSEELPEDVRDRAYHAQKVWKRIVVIAAGPLVNLVLGFVLLLLFFSLVGPYESSNRVKDVDPEFPAAGAIQPGDRLISVDGRTGTPLELSQAIAEHTCPGGRQVDGCRAAEPAVLVVKRPDGMRDTLRLRPVYDADPEVRRPRLGFLYEDPVQVPEPLGKAFGTTLDRFWFITRETVLLPIRLFDPVKVKELSGVVGIYETTRQTIVEDPGDAIAILAIISMLLAVINLFPFLPLDGGHIFWAVVEKVTGRPVSLATMERAGVIGIILLIPLVVIGFTNDLERLAGEGFGPR
jgi:regulator of sigma E protease